MRGAINILLALIGRISIAALALVLYITGLIFSKNRAQYHLNIGISYDQLGNVLGGPLFDIIFKKPNGKSFGHPDETISFVLGRNKKMKRLTWLGRLVGYTLNAIDKDHLEKVKS